MLEGDEYEDHLLGDPNQLDDLIEGRDLENSENEAENVAEEAGNDQGSGDEKIEKKTVKRVLNPQPKLDANRLTGPKGIIAIEGLFKDFEFRGSGYEDHDLNRIMKRLELWGNRLFPKLQFDDLLEKVEKLGHKRPVLNFVSKVRMGLVNEDTVAENSKENQEVMDVEDVSGVEVITNHVDIFEQLLAEQSSTQPVQQTIHSETQITEEQRERMMRNRKLAEERRMARTKAHRENVENSSVTTVAEFNKVADMGNVGESHSLISEQDSIQVPSFGNDEKGLKNEVNQTMSWNGEHKNEVTESYKDESNKGEIERKESSSTFDDVNESMEVNSINSVGISRNNSDSINCVEHTSFNSKASETGDGKTDEDPPRDAEMME